MPVKSIKILFFLVLVPVVLGGCSGDKAKTSHILERDIGGELVHDTVTIKASGSYEECIELHPGLVFDYDFDASGFVDFNIHYHAEDEIHEPVHTKGVMFGKGRIDPSTHNYYTKEQEFYCLMWENMNDGPVEVSFKCVLEQKEGSTHDMHH